MEFYAGRVTAQVIIYMDYSLYFGVDYFYFLFFPDERHDFEYFKPESSSSARVPLPNLHSNRAHHTAPRTTPSQLRAPAPASARVTRNTINRVISPQVSHTWAQKIFPVLNHGNIYE